MIIKSIYIKEGLFDKNINFSDNVTLIYSEKNSCGKTTLIRFILYALGYNVPNTRKINFNNCEVLLNIDTENVGEVSLLRYNDTVIEVTYKESKETFIMPDRKNDLHKILFGIENLDILNNLLGAFYIDQEKGWTLLNRGIVINGVNFNIEEFVRGLSGVDCSDSIDKESKLSRKINKYTNMSNVSKYREQIINSGEFSSISNYAEEQNAIEYQLLIQQKNLNKELKRIDRILADNKRFKKFVSDMKLFVESPDGQTFAVTENNIVGLTDSINILISKRRIISSNLKGVEDDLKIIQQKQIDDINQFDEISQTNLFKGTNLIDFFDNQLANIPINHNLIQNELEKLKKDRKLLQEDIKKQTKLNNELYRLLHETLNKYLIELGVNDNANINTNYIFTNNLKELSGAILHKTVFAFRLVYILAIESILNIKLPIIIDSPSGKEVDKENINLMIEILKRDFASNQLIIASIFNYDFDELTTIEIKEKLIDEIIKVK